jgi:hypothetical protein
MIAIISLPMTSPFPFLFQFFSIPPLIVYLCTGLASTMVAVAIMVTVWD